MITDSATTDTVTANGAETSDSRTSSLMFLGMAIAMGTLVFFGVFAAGKSLFGGTSEDDDEPDALAAVAEEAAWEPAGEADIDQFVADWEHSLTGRYSLSGVLERISLTDDESTYGLASTGDDETDQSDRIDQPLTLPVRRVQLDNLHSLYQVGPTATVIDPINGTRNCQRRDGAFWCASETPSRGRPLGPETLSVGVEQAVRGEAAGYRLYRMVDYLSSDIAATAGAAQLDRLAEQLRCWDVRALTGDHGHQWGRRSQFCFDATTGAPILNRTFGQYRTETFMAHQLSANVSLQDLDPK